MTRTTFMVGISALAFAASAASAQTTTTTNGDNTDANTGNRVLVSCVAGNSCSVTQTAGQTFSSTGAAIAQSGVQNSVTVMQIGNRQYAQSRAFGDRNSSTVNQRGGFNNTATIDQTSNISGTAAAAAKVNIADVIQGNAAGNNGNNNIAQIGQNRTQGAADTAGFNTSSIHQGTISGGYNNTAVSTQTGTSMSSIIYQYDGAAGAATTRAAIGNSATVTQLVTAQTGTGSSSTVNQSDRGQTAKVLLGGGGTTATTANTSLVNQYNNRVLAGTGGTFTDNAAVDTTVSGNLADVAIIGTQNSSSVRQNGAQNVATVNMLTGGPGNTGATPTNGAAGTAFPANRREGNTVDLSQSGVGNQFVGSTGADRRYDTTLGRGNLATVRQGVADGATGGAANAAGGANANSNARNMYASLYQFGFIDTVTLDQVNNSVGGTAGTSLQSGSSATIAQGSKGSTATITQTGTNIADVTQGLNADKSGGQDMLTLTQTDAGDMPVSGTNPTDPFGNGGTAGSSTPQRNYAATAQYGTNNSGTVVQNSVNASASLFQKQASLNNTSTQRQGTGAANSALTVANQPATATTGASSANLTSYVTQSGMGDTAFVLQDGNNNSANVTQSGVNTSGAAPANSNSTTRVVQTNAYNSATVSQGASGGSTVLVYQIGTGTLAKPNVAFVDQTGRNQYARVIQLQGAGASGTTAATSPQAGIPGDTNFPNSRTAGTAYSAEARIIQTASGNSATVQQAGKGQYGRITQSGMNNVGFIDQQAGATNAVAILEQSGNTNTYSITQTDPGQYFYIVQSGNGNAATGTTITQRAGGTPANGGGFGSPTVVSPANP